MMTLQEVYSKVRNHLLAQNARSEEEFSGTCMYRGEEGRMCAVGCMIPNYKYHRSLERQLVNVPAVRDALDDTIPDTAYDLLCELQSIHDGQDPSQWLACLDNLAKRRGLSTGTTQA